VDCKASGVREDVLVAAVLVGRALLVVAMVDPVEEGGGGMLLTLAVEAAAA